MDKVAEAISQIFPFSQLFEKLGLSKEVSAALSVLLALLIVYVLAKLIKSLIRKHEWHKAAMDDLKPQFDYLSVKKARQFYIPTQFQNASPSRQEEPAFTHKYIARDRLIPFFIKTAFKEEADSERFYLILADSGMGKTTFMVNLYLEYHSFFSRRRKHKMTLFRFSNPDTINQIKVIDLKESKNTILLLDALDEDQGIISADPAITDEMAFRNRVDEIIELTKNFREVVITCRTQYFPGQEDDPYELKIKRPDERGYYTLNKIYLSPFNDKEVKKYLNKKFGILPFVNLKKKKRALNIVSRSRNLVMRPMLLSYIDFLIQDDVTYTTAFKTYETLVSKWLLREAEKRKGINDREEFIKSLNNLSRQTAIRIYLNWKYEGRMYVTKEEAYEIAKHYDIELKPEEITGQSLLTCDGVVNWKFAHKSILEFFLALEAYSNPMFLREMDFKGMDMAKRFYWELNPRFIRVPINGINENKFLSKSHLYIYSSPITKDEFSTLMGEEYETSSVGSFCVCSLENAIAYCNKMNEEKGYAHAYTKDDLLNIWSLRRPNDDGASYASDMHGFRLLTRNEHKFVFGEEGKIALNQAGEVAITYLSSEDTGHRNRIIIPYIHEWCFDVHGDSKRWIEAPRSDIIPKFHLYLVENQVKHNIEENKGKACFRLVFIP